MKVSSRLVVLAAIPLLAAAGSFFGMWGWAQWQAHTASKQQREQAARIAEEEHSPMGIQRAVVRARLKDPESAQFRNVHLSPRDPETWCGELNARNSMGGLVGFTRYIAVVSKDREGAVYDHVTIEPVSATSDETKAEQQAFNGKWSAYCE